MDGPRDYLKWNKSDRERQILDVITYVESKKYNKLVNIAKKSQTHRYREQTSGYQLGQGKGEGEEIKEVQVAMYEINKQGR